MEDDCRTDDQQQAAANTLHPMVEKLIFQNASKAQPPVTTTLLGQQQRLLTLQAHALQLGGLIFLLLGGDGVIGFHPVLIFGAEQALT